MSDQVHPRLPLPALLLLLAPLGGCASSHPGAPAPVDYFAAPRGALITVENQNPLDARVDFVREGTRIPLGRLDAHSTRTFTVTSAELGTGGGLFLSVTLLPSRERYTSPWIPVASGDHVAWTVATHLVHSRASVRRIILGPGPD